jgi:hypothetical protein
MTFFCDKCGKSFDKKFCLQAHLNRKKPCNEIDQHKFICEACGKEYSNRDSYRKHKLRSKKCQYQEQIQDDQESGVSDINNNTASNKHWDALSNSQLDTTQKIFELEKKVIELTSQLSSTPKLNQVTTDNSSNHNNNTSTNNNSNNTLNNSNNTLNNTSNTYLLNYVVKNYPNAKNIEDCVNVKNISPKLLKDCYDLYFLEGSMHIIKEMCDIGEEHRPFHCTDASRGNYIYKTNDVWKIDVGGEEIKSHIIPVINSTYRDVHSKRIADNPNSSETRANMCFEMTHENIRKTCGKALKKVTTSFIAKNIKNSKLQKHQISKF